MRTRGRAAASAAGVLALLACSVSMAMADTTGHWASIGAWDNDAKTATVSIPGVTGFPSAALASTSAGSAGPESGSTRWLAPFTPPGAVFGSSQGQQYLSLRPAANNASAPSTSTYTFARATPTTGWAFTLGDVDAEYLDVSAIGTDGAPVDLDDLGFSDAFNYCQGTPKPSGCDASKAQPVPLWDPATGRLAGPQTDPDGNPIPGWSDTDGAAAWFRPTVALRSLTVTATQRVGSPTYQTWFAGLSRDITGTVTPADGCSADDVPVVLRDADGVEVASTTTDDDGTWSFDDVATYDDWVVDVTAPSGCQVVNGARRDADVSTDDAVVDTTLELVPVVDPPDEDGDPPTDGGGGSGSGSGSGIGVTPSDDVLPDTGAPSAWPAWWGCALVAVGAGLVLGRPSGRRRRD